MRVCFILPNLKPSGGTAVVLDHARRLLQTGRFHPEVVVTGQIDPAAVDTGEVPVKRLVDLGDERYDVALATWWETAASLYEIRSSRRCVFLQSIEHRFYREEDVFERLGAAAVLGLPVDFIAVAGWMRELLVEVRPDARCQVVVNGIDKSVFMPRNQSPPLGPLRVLVEGQPSLWFKGVQDAVRAVRSMTGPVHLTLACLDDREAVGVDADRIVGGLSPTAMASLYAETDVLVKLARVEGLGLAPLEAFHVGVPCVLTPYTGHEEYARHNENSLIVGLDDGPGTTSMLDLLARDRGTLARLGAGAAATAATWPSAAESSERLADALQAIAQSEAPPDVAALAHLHRILAFQSGVGRHRIGTGEWARHQVKGLTASHDECARLLDHAEMRIAEITDSRGYRMMAAMRETLNRVRR